MVTAAVSSNSTPRKPRAALRCKFEKPTVTYASMQAIGMVNDHTMDCIRYREIAREFADAN
jgi:3-methyladenine DNA glycosylase Tag